jgi:hypothetical protein
MGLFGMEAFTVEVEADISSGLPSFEVVEYNILTIKKYKKPSLTLLVKDG